ncbi:MAG: diadenosine tetraphosphate hydrolase [Nanoarchaeota archaeon]|jgi:diadenosine tetraphosphate (Ap4A) HIT family hydrolase|nr:diadenosine tetraphosphate hydrolase [Nanoarchaeota archaeon]
MEEKKVSEVEKIFADEIIYETDYFSVNQDWEIAIPGFYIVSPKRKVNSLMEFNDKEDIDFIRTVKKIRKAMLEVLNIEYIYLFQNEDTPWDFHFWMMPYYDWMKDISRRGPSLLAPVWKYAKENMNTKKDIKKTRDAAEKMRVYFSKK